MTHKPSMTCEPSISEVALGCVSGGLFGRHGRSVPRELDFEEPECQEGPFRTELRLNRHSMYVCVLGSDPEAPEEVQGLIGLTPDELNLCQSLDTDLAFIFAWLEGEMEPEEGELFLASPAVKNNQINRNLFFPGLPQSPLEKIGGGGGEAASGGPQGAQAGSPQSVP